MNKILLLFVLVLLTGCFQQPTDIDSVIDRGLKYLKDHYSDKGGYDDKYLQFIYSGENLECPLSNCELTYRLLDGYFDVLFIKKEFEDSSGISHQVSRATEVFDVLTPIWRKGTIYNIIKAGPEDKDGFALDTYCIFGLIQEDEVMAQNVADRLNGLHWMNWSMDYVAVDDWRYIADESWCIRLMVNTGHDVNDLTDEMIKNTRQFIEDEHSIVNKAAVVMHLIYVLDDVNNSIFESDFKFFKDYLKELSFNDEIGNDMLTQSNILHCLATAGYENQEYLSGVVDHIIENQRRDGGWLLYEDKEKMANVFTTFRVVLGLNVYRLNYGI